MQVRRSIVKDLLGEVAMLTMHTYDFGLLFRRKHVEKERL
jgi:hypothetical protein